MVFFFHAGFEDPFNLWNEYRYLNYDGADLHSVSDSWFLLILVSLKKYRCLLAFQACFRAFGVVVNNCAFFPLASFLKQDLFSTLYAVLLFFIFDPHGLHFCLLCSHLSIIEVSRCCDFGSYWSLFFILYHIIGFHLLPIFPLYDYEFSACILALC